MAFEVSPSAFPESLSKAGLRAEDYARETATRKALDVAARKCQVWGRGLGRDRDTPTTP